MLSEVITPRYWHGGISRSRIENIHAGRCRITSYNVCYTKLLRVDALRASNRISLYQKMFMNDLIRDGIAITEKYELPYGFRPLCLPLSDKEIKRYILKVTRNNFV